MCARVCPTETLCEEACVRETAEDKPVEIGLLQRYATDDCDAAGQAVLRARRADGQEGRRGRRRPGGPRLRAPARAATAMTSRSSRRKPKAGGLNEYGIAAYKTVDDFAQAEVDYVTAIGGIDDRARPARSAATSSSPT